MDGKIIMNLAMSIDGYIADKDGSYDWILGHGDHSLDTKEQHSFEDFLNDIDIVVMGKNCYTQGFAKEYKKKTVYVAAHQSKPAEGNIHFINGDIVKFIRLKKEKGKRIYLFGGGILIDGFIKENIIDEYIIGTIPIILGKGRPLFLGNTSTIPLLLSKYSINDGITISHYVKRN